MGHPAIVNETALACELLFVADEEGQLLLVPVVKGTYELERSGRLTLAAKQLPVSLTGEWWGKPGESSCRYEAEMAVSKVGTDIAVIAHAYAPKGRARELDVLFRVGDVEKTIRVFGDRRWKMGLGGTSMTSPDWFERIPLVYERAFGGWDRSSRDPKKHGYEPRNPIGIGYRCKTTKPGSDDMLPNLEDPRCLMRNPYETPPPAGFGFISPNWAPRHRYAGTYDDNWMRERMPLLPRDFDRRFFNAAVPDLVNQRGVKGDEAIVVTNTSQEGRLEFALPGAVPPECEVNLRGHMNVHLTTRLDTVVINTDDRVVTLTWRGGAVGVKAPTDVAKVRIQAGPTRP